ncbi:MAG: helix-turn-helix domain-containing protein, partial [Chloroflexota bacterium]|nr:helix-turn-helix domain-containing protein [Chloroflexota bacterium]
YWGDNVVWQVAGRVSAEPFFRAVVRRRRDYDHATYVTLDADPHDVAARFEGVDVLDARAGSPFARPGALLAEIEKRCRRFGQSLVLFEPLERMAEAWGGATASRFFTRCCPELLESGAIAYWSLTAAGSFRDLRRNVEDVTQCVFVLGDDRLRIAKAEGRRPGVEGSVFRVRVEDGLPVLTPAPVTARIGAALHALRVERQLTQSDLARLAGVTPSAISQAERGQRGLSLETLLALAGELNVTLDELLRGERESGYRLARRHEETRDGGARPMALLDDPRVGLRAYLVRVPPRATRAPHLTHKGPELVAVVRGLVQVVLATGRPVLRAGEALLAEQTGIVNWRNLGSTEATLFWVLRDETRR